MEFQGTNLLPILQIEQGRQPEKGLGREHYEGFTCLEFIYTQPGW